MSSCDWQQRRDGILLVPVLAECLTDSLSYLRQVRLMSDSHRLWWRFALLEIARVSPVRFQNARSDLLTAISRFPVCGCLGAWLQALANGDSIVTQPLSCDFPLHWPGDGAGELPIVQPGLAACAVFLIASHSRRICGCGRVRINK